MELRDTGDTLNIRWLLISVTIIILDQLSKSLALSHLTLARSVEITSFFNFTLLFNQGAAFSFLNNAGGWQHWLFGSIAMCVCIGILYLIFHLVPTARGYLVSLSIILGGAIGNLWDRIQHGYVVDFLHFHFHDWHFAIFNLADSAITLGTILLLALQFADLKRHTHLTNNH